MHIGEFHHPSQKHLACTACKHKAKVVLARHERLAFGFTSAVYAWDDVGDLICVLLRRLLHIPALSWVDDIFSASKLSVAEHALSCAVRLIRALLGDSAVQDRKTGFGSSLDVLGMYVSLVDGMCAVLLTEEKRSKWLSYVRAALLSSRLVNSLELAGWLTFAARHTFRCLGRAMI